MKTRAQMINQILAALGITDHIGLSIEPIMAGSDPDDEIDADYQLKIMYEVPSPDDGSGETDRFFCGVFAAGIPMQRFREMSDEDFVHNMFHLLTQFAEYRERAIAASASNAEGVGFITRDGVQVAEGAPPEMGVGAITDTINRILDDKHGFKTSGD